MVGEDEYESMASHATSDEEIDAELMLRDFREFIPAAFPHAEPSTTYKHNWHIDVIADHLQAVTLGEISRLLINVPPGTMKSLLCCVLWPAWMWARAPSLRFIFSTYSEDFTKRDARKMRNLVQSGWYRSHFTGTRIARMSRAIDGLMVPDTVLEYGTTVGGLRSGAATSSGVTGKHVHGVCEDDPMKAQDAYSKAARDHAWRFHKGTLSSRLLPDGDTWRVVTMQRLHTDDPSGRILREEDSYVHLLLPMHYAPSRVKHTQLGIVDPREIEGELLWPDRMSEAFVKARDKDLGPYDAAAQEEQAPTSIDGGVIKRAWLAKRWTRQTKPEKFDIEWISCDPAMKDTNDSVAIQHWGYVEGTFYLLRRVARRMDFIENAATLLEFARLAGPQGALMSKVVEDKANGEALYRTLRQKVPGFETFNPQGEKLVRLMAVSPSFASLAVVIPDVTEDPGIDDYVEELCGFPHMLHDDEVDATTQALLFFRSRYDILGETQDFGDMGMGAGTLRDPSMA